MMHYEWKTCTIDHVSGLSDACNCHSRSVRFCIYNSCAYWHTPVIDGTIGSTEWNDAFTGTYNYTDYFVKQDGNSLYFGFNVSDSTVNLNYDAVAVAIDMLNDGGSTRQSDDIDFYVFRNGTLLEFTDNNPVTPPTGGWNAAFTSDSSGWQIEFAIDFGKIGIVNGQPKTLGMALIAVDISGPTFWPPMSSGYGPTYWGNLDSLQNWVPEFPSILVVPPLIVVTLLAAVVYRRKSKPSTAEN